MANFTHEIHDDSGLKFLWDDKSCSVYNLEGELHCIMSREWGEGVKKGGSYIWKMKDIPISLENE